MWQCMWLYRMQMISEMFRNANVFTDVGVIIMGDSSPFLLNTDSEGSEMSPLICQVCEIPLYFINFNSKPKVNWLFLLAAGGYFQNREITKQCTK